MDRDATVRPVIEPDAAAVSLDDPLAGGETDAGARLPRVEPLEHAEDSLSVGGWDATPVVGQREPPLDGTIIGVDRHAKGPLGRSIPNCVPEHVSKDTAKLPGVHHERADRPTLTTAPTASSSGRSSAIVSSTKTSPSVYSR